MNLFHASPANFLRWAVLYLVFGVTLGNYMGKTGDFSLSGVHAHANLLGWASMAIAGLIYKAWPAALATRLATAHWWIQLLGVPVMLTSLAFFLRGSEAAMGVLGPASLVVGLGWVLFAVNLFRTVRD